MTTQATVNKIADYIKVHQQRSGGHDWWHVYRVWKTARIIAKKEGANLVIVQIAALLHDLADWKFHGEESQVRTAEKTLKKFHVDDNTTKLVLEIIENISFKGPKEKSRMRTIEGKVVQDADRLDALGALGVARVFEYGGTKGMAMHDPTRRIKKILSREEYGKSASGKGTSTAHFYQKILLLKSRMNTETAKRIAGTRHKFLKSYLAEFFKEWKMEDVN